MGKATEGYHDMAVLWFSMIFCDFYDFPWFSVIFHYFLWFICFYVILCYFYDFLWFSMIIYIYDFLCFLWFSMIFCDFLWISMISMILCDFVWSIWFSMISYDLYDFLWLSVIFHEFVWFYVILCDLYDCFSFYMVLYDFCDLYDFLWFYMIHWFTMIFLCDVLWFYIIFWRTWKLDGCRYDSPIDYRQSIPLMRGQDRHLCGFLSQPLSGRIWAPGLMTRLKPQLGYHWGSKDPEMLHDSWFTTILQPQVCTKTAGEHCAWYRHGHWLALNRGIPTDVTTASSDVFPLLNLFAGAYVFGSSRTDKSNRYCK